MNNNAYKVTASRESKWSGYQTIYATASAVLFGAFLAHGAYALEAAKDVNKYMTGMQAIAGSVTLGGQTDQLSVLNVTNKTVLNWQKFSIPEGMKVQYRIKDAMSGGGIVLNRVLGNEASKFLGSLDSGNGQVIFVNPNGFVMGDKFKLHSGDLIFSRLDVEIKEFLKHGSLTIIKANGNEVALDVERFIKKQSTPAVYFVKPDHTITDITGKSMLADVDWKASSPSATLKNVTTADLAGRKANTKHTRLVNAPDFEEDDSLDISEEEIEQPSLDLDLPPTEKAKETPVTNTEKSTSSAGQDEVVKQVTPPPVTQPEETVEQPKEEKVTQPEAKPEPKPEPTPEPEPAPEEKPLVVKDNSVYLKENRQAVILDAANEFVSYKIQAGNSAVAVASIGVDGGLVSGTQDFATMLASLNGDSDASDFTVADNGEVTIGDSNSSEEKSSTASNSSNQKSSDKKKSNKKREQAQNKAAEEREKVEQLRQAASSVSSSIAGLVNGITPVRPEITKAVPKVVLQLRDRARLRRQQKTLNENQATPTPTQAEPNTEQSGSAQVEQPTAGVTTKVANVLSFDFSNEKVEVASYSIKTSTLPSTPRKAKAVLAKAKVKKSTKATAVAKAKAPTKAKAISAQVASKLKGSSYAYTTVKLSSYKN